MTVVHLLVQNVVFCFDFIQSSNVGLQLEWKHLLH